MEKEDIIRKGEELSKEDSLIGKQYFASFLPEAFASNVPVEFVSALKNYRSALSTSTKTAEEYFKQLIETARHLLGIDCQNDLEAAYVICRAQAISFVKKLPEVSNEEESEVLEREAQEKLGATIHCAAMIVLPYTLPEIMPGVRKRNKAARRDQLRSLREQIENNMENDQLRSRIILLASQRRI